LRSSLLPHPLTRVVLTSLPSKQIGPIFLARLDHANPINCILKDRRFDVTEGGYLAGGAIGCFLNDMAGVPLRPLPLDLMATRRFIQTFPPVMICLAAKAPFHRLDHVTRVRVQTHATRFP